MYGLLNSALREYVVNRYGHDTWTTVTAKAKVGDQIYGRMTSYPDSVIYDLVATVSEETGESQDSVLENFGESWVKYTDQNGYGSLFSIAGDSLREFLLSLDELHAKVGRSFPNLVPPQFRFGAIDANTLRMHYISSRKGLCPMIPGLLRGLSVKFNTPVEVEEAACSRLGASHCEFVILLQPISK